MVTHPSHLSRYAIEPPGLFVPNRRPDRTLLEEATVVFPTATRQLSSARCILHMHPNPICRR